MVERITPAPSLRPTASPVDRFVAPVAEQPKDSWLSGAAEALSTLNPALQQFIGSRHDEYAAEEEAKGAQAEAGLDPSLRFQENRQAWRELITAERKRDREEGTNNGDRVAAASPHFRRGAVRARLNRVGMGLNDYLMNAWRDNPSVGGVPLHELDDPDALQQWVMGQTNAYTERYGVTEVDPLLYAETLQPRIQAAQDGFLSRHTEFRLSRHTQEYMTELSMGTTTVMSGGGTTASSVGSFLDRLAGRESGGNYGASNNERGSSGRNGHFGLIQFGHDRFEEAKAAGAVPSDMTIEQFGSNTPEGRAAQNAANKWHIEDIDSFIASNGFLDKGYSLDGMRAVAHLGGKQGMRQFIRSGGEYDPADSFGTKLSDYYNRFSGPTAELQQMRDTAVADGMNPDTVNRTVVQSIISTATQTGNAAVLDQVALIDAGSGPLGNIGWVKDEVDQARTRIERANYQAEKQAAAVEEAERKSSLNSLEVEATRALLENPYADITQWQETALNLDSADMATDIGDLQSTLVDRVYDVETNHEVLGNLRIGLSTGEISGEEFIQEVRRGVGVDFPASAATQLMDDYDRLSEGSDLMRDTIVRDTVSDVESVIKERFAQSPQFPGDPRIPGTEKGVEAKRWMQTRLTAYVLDNAEATRADVRDEADRLSEQMLRSTRWQKTAEEANGSPQRNFGTLTQQYDTDLDDNTVASTMRSWSATGHSMPSSEDLTTEQLLEINRMASARGVTAKDLMVQFGIITEGN